MQVIKKYATTTAMESALITKMTQQENTLFDGSQMLFHYGKHYSRLLFKVKDPAKSWWMAYIKYTHAWAEGKVWMTEVILEEATADVLESSAWKLLLSKHSAGLQTPHKMSRDHPENYEVTMAAITKLSKPIVKALIKKKAEALKTRALAVGLKEDATEEAVITAEELKQAKSIES